VGEMSMNSAHKIDELIEIINTPVEIEDPNKNMNA